MRVKKAQRIYWDMQRAAEQGYKVLGHWNWTDETPWAETESIKLMNDIKKIAKREMYRAVDDFKEGKISKEECIYIIDLNKQIIKFADARIKIKKEILK